MINKFLHLIVTFFILITLCKISTGEDGQSKSDAELIGRIICEPSDKHDETWFKCIECCQSINCYFLVSRIIFYYFIFIFILLLFSS